MGLHGTKSRGHLVESGCGGGKLSRTGFFEGCYVEIPLTYGTCSFGDAG
jgi:hypothetical protein